MSNKSEGPALLHRLEAAVAKTPSSDDLHVQVVKEALARKEYSVDASRLAAKLMRFESNLSRKP